MSEANLNKVTKHVSRINPQLSVNEFGDVIWTPCLVDYDANLFYRGKTVTNDEFNKLFLQQVYQGNYTTDSLIELLKIKTLIITDIKAQYYNKEKKEI